MQLEREFLALLIHDPDLTMRTAVRPEDLADPVSRMIYSAILKLIRDGVRPDLATVSRETGEPVAVAEIGSPSSLNFEYFEKALREKIQHHRLKMAAATFLELLDSGEECSDIVAKVEELVSASSVEHEHRQIKSLYECAMEFGPILEKRAKTKGELVGIPTGFDLLDRFTGGFQAGTYYIGARPSQGKTALMLSLMRSALHAGHGAGLISIESSDMDLIARVISAEGPVLADGLRKGSLLSWEYNALKEALVRLEKWNGRVYFNTKTDVQTLEAVARRMVKTHGVEILFVDYLQRINARGGNKFEQVTAASRAITDIAKGYGVPVVCLAQTGRLADSEAPSLSHFQHSSAIEQDADVAMVIHHSKNEGGKEDSELIVLKNRDGEVGTVPVFFDRPHVRFAELAREGAA